MILKWHSKYLNHWKISQLKRPQSIQHVVSHIRKCTECHSAFKTSWEIKRHRKYFHTHERPHRCTKCNYAAVELCKLNLHMKSHHNVEKNHLTFTFNKRTQVSFQLPKWVSRYIRYRHKQDKQNHCPFCNYACVELFSLKLHIKCQLKVV